MDFRMEAILPAAATEIWAIFFDVQRIATLIPGCENVVEVEPFSAYTAVMKQRIGVFKLEVPTEIAVESYAQERTVALRAKGRDKFTGTALDVRLTVALEASGEPDATGCTVTIDAHMQVAGRLASLGYPIVKKRSVEIFSEFEKRLREELVRLGSGTLAAGA